MSTKASTVKSKRDELIEVASGLFYKQGYNCTGVQQIISEAGIAKGTFYSHFKSKEELGVAWLKNRHQYWLQRLFNYLADKKTPKSKIIGAFDWVESWMSECDMRGCAFINTLCETPDTANPLRQEIISHKNELRAFFQSLVDEHFSDRSKKARTQIATTLYILLEGTILETQLYRDSSMVEAARSQVKSILQS
jgi:AcrR family transcriptional regulator